MTNADVRSRDRAPSDNPYPHDAQNFAFGVVTAEHLGQLCPVRRAPTRDPQVGQ